MHRILVVFSAITFVVCTNGASLELSTSIKQDTIELAQLMEQFWSLKPAVAQHQGLLAMCQWIDDCCEAEDRSKAISFMHSTSRRIRIDSNSPEVINTCRGSTALNKVDQSCPSLLHFIYSPLFDHDHPAMQQFLTVTEKYNKQLLALMDGVQQSCNDYERHAFLCLLDKKLVQSCAAKMLQDIYDNQGYKDYYEFMTEMKQSLTGLNQELAHLSLQNTNTN